MRQFRQRCIWFDETVSPLRSGEELVIDCFAGGGGASLGITQAIGRPPDAAINHDKAAIAMHLANHSETHHWCENLWDVEPEEVTEGRPIGAAWFSPDCTHFSKAKGDAPKDGKIRALAWIVIRWAARVRPRVIFLENVEEFVTWGPLDTDGKVIPELKGETFRAFTGALEGGVSLDSPAVAEMREYLKGDVDQYELLNGLGYTVEWKLLTASDYGTPTTRKRLFLVARCDGEPIVWPEPTHGSPKEIAKRLKKRGSCNLQKWRTAAEIIDWSIPCPSIFLTREEAKAQGLNVKRPLEEKTLKRIAEGIRRYVIEHPAPFIVSTNHGGEHFRGQPLSRPLSTVTRSHGYGVVDPVLSPFITSSAYSKSSGRGKYIYHPEEPLRTLTTTNDKVVVTPFLAALQNGGLLRGIDHPLHTVTASRKDCNLVVAPMIASYYGPKGEDGHRGRMLTEPLPTQPTENRFALVSAFIAKHFGGMVGTQNQLVAAHITKMNFGSKPCTAADDPLHTIVAGGQTHALTTSHLMKLYGTSQHGAPLDRPMPTVTSTGQHIAEVRAFLMRYFSSGGQWSRVDAPTPTITTKDRLCLGIVLIGGEPFQIVDIGMRMLSPRELFRAQGFPDSYEIDTGLNGKPAPKHVKVARCGNSVCPQVVAAVVRANFSPRTVSVEPTCAT